MPIIAPHPIKSTSITTYGHIVGLEMIRFQIPELGSIPISPHPAGIYEQVLVGQELPALSESLNRAETVVITNV